MWEFSISGVTSLHLNLTCDEIHDTQGLLELQVLSINEEYLMWDMRWNYGHDKTEDRDGREIKSWNE